MKDELERIRTAAAAREAEEARLAQEAKEEEARLAQEAEEERLKVNLDLQDRYSKKFKEVLANIEDSTDSLLEARNMLKDEVLTEDEKGAIEQLIADKEKEIREGQQEVQGIGEELENRDIKPKEVEQLEKDLDEAVERADAKREKEAAFDVLKEEAERLDSEIRAAVEDLMREVLKYGHLASMDEMSGLGDSEGSYKDLQHQISGVVGGARKLYGRIDLKRSGITFNLIRKSRLNSLAGDVEDIAAKLEAQKEFISEKSKSLKGLIELKTDSINSLVNERYQLDKKVQGALLKGDLEDVTWSKIDEDLGNLVFDRFNGERYEFSSEAALNEAIADGVNFSGEPSDPSLEPPYSKQEVEDMRQALGEIQGKVNKIA